VRETLIQLTPWLLSKGLELVFDVDDAPYRVTTDAGAINIALTNLVTNAANFSPEYGVITVRLCQVPKRFVLTVDDQGPGIEESERDRLFELFYSRGNAEGAGLGLTIVHTIAQRLGGQVRLENLAAGGLRATLEIPQS
jgi:two-component system sensor histidine kinase QseC